MTVLAERMLHFAVKSICHGMGLLFFKANAFALAKSVEFALRYDLRLTVFPFPAANSCIRNAQFFCKRFLRQQQFHPHILHFLGKLHRTPHSSTLPSSNLDLSSAKIFIWRIAVLFNSTSRSDWLTPRSIKYAFKFSRLERQISCNTSA